MHFVSILISATFLLAAADAMKMGVVSYWGSNAASYSKLPAGSYGIVNPESGIFTGQSTTLVSDLKKFQTVVNQTVSRGVVMLGYVPTGYFNHNCNQGGKCQKLDRIDAQVKAYFKNMPNLKGIFFDEASPDPTWNCMLFPSEYQALRKIVRKYSAQAKIAFNPGTPDNCAVSGTNSGELLVLFEGSEAEYRKQASNVKTSTATAVKKGVVPWHLVYSVTESKLSATFQTAQDAKASLFYATNVGGGETWNTPPPYWSKEVALFK